MSYVQGLLLILCVQSGSLSLYLFLVKRGKPRANRILAGLFLTLAVHMLLNLLEYNPSRLEVTSFNHILGFLYGPIFWLYVWHLTHETVPINAKNGWLFLPFLLASALLIGWNVTFFGPFILVYTLVLLGLCLRAIRSYERLVTQSQSNVQRVSLDWLKQFLWVVLGLLLLDTIQQVVSTNAPGLTNPFFGLVLGIFILSIHALVFRSINHTDGFMGLSHEELSLQEIAPSYPKPPVQMAEQLDDLMAREKLFKQPDLTLSQFAELTNHTPREVSQAINMHFMTNFSDWVNTYRIDHAKGQLQAHSNSEKNISQILFESGFSSVSSFYKVFNQKVGMSPRKFRSSSEFN